MAGINKLTDLSVSKSPARLVFSNAVSGRLCEADLEASDHFGKIADRLEDLKNLEHYLDKNMVVFRWDNNKAKSTIVADYLLEENTSDSLKAYFFLKEKKSLFDKRVLKVSEIRKKSGVSFFRDGANLTKEQVKYTLLRNEKINKTSGESILLYEYKR